MARTKKRVLIMGAGPHGTSAGIHLLDRLQDRVELSIVDPVNFLGNWKAVAEAMAMTQLRSPWAHAAYDGPRALQTFARKHSADFAVGAASEERPPIEVFDAHTLAGVDEYGLRDLRIPAKVTRIQKAPTESGYIVRLVGANGGSEDRHTDFVVCCTGLGVPRVPRIIQGVRSDLVIHSNDAGEALGGANADQKFCVVGAGLTAGEMAIALTDKGATVTMLTRRALATQPLDFDASWFGGTRFQEFFASSARQRIELLEAADIHPSVTPAVRELMRRAESRGLLQLRESVSVTRFETDLGRGTVQVWSEGESLGRFGRVILATGYEHSVDRLPLNGLASEIETHRGLPVFHGKVPEVLYRIYITGVLAQLFGGPASPNIQGGAMAAEKIAEDIAAA